MSINMWLHRLHADEVVGRHEAEWDDDAHFCIDKFETATLMAMHELQAAGLLPETLDLRYLAGEILDDSSMLMATADIAKVRACLGPLGRWFTTEFDPSLIERRFAPWPWWEPGEDGLGDHLAKVIADFDAFLAVALANDQVVVASYG